ncbi:MAG: hypothetical protein ACI837_001959 [Crocinitomicaceae bacterium]|jgi:hypothetical protein
MEITKLYRFFIVSIGIGFLMAFSWRSEGVTPEEYKKQYSEKVDAFSMVSNDHGVEYSLKFVPKELQVISSYSKGVLTITEAEEWLKESENEVRFMLQIEIPENGRQEFLKYESENYSYEDRVKYYAFDFAKDIEVWVDEKQKLELNSFNFEREFGVSPKGTMILSVNIPKNAKNLSVKFTDQVYGTDSQSFLFDLKEFNSLPRLKNIKKW